MRDTSKKNQLYVLFLFSTVFLAGAVLSVPAGAQKPTAHSGGALRIERHRAPIKSGPSNSFKLRGMAVKDSLLPILESKEGEGCEGYWWYKVHEEGWICGRYGTIVPNAPSATPQPPMESDRVTPWPYAFLKESAIEYQWSRHGWLEEIREIFKGFGFAVKKRITIDDQRYFKTPEGKLIPTYAARVSKRISTFQGVNLSGAQPWPFGWVNAKDVWAYSEPSRKKELRARLLTRYDFFSVVSDKIVKKQKFFQLAEGLWVSERDVRVASSSTRPEGVLPTEKWIDVDIKQQIVTAYEGDTPVYATMVSTGRYGGSRTIKGAFRVWVKVAAIAMDNTDEEEDLDTDSDTAEIATERKLYSLQDVPWTQFFQGNYALHAVYWHDRFGNRKSHGCINMAPLDAKWFYDWTSPTVPSGWWSVYSTDDDKGTMVRVR